MLANYLQIITCQASTCKFNNNILINLQGCFHAITTSFLDTATTKVVVVKTKFGLSSECCQWQWQHDAHVTLQCSGNDNMMLMLLSCSENWNYDQVWVSVFTSPSSSNLLPATGYWTLCVSDCLMLDISLMSVCPCVIRPLLPIINIRHTTYKISFQTLSLMLTQPLIMRSPCCLSSLKFSEGLGL